MNKIGSSEGGGWFFATLVIFFILVIFFTVTKLIFTPIKQVTPEISFSNFNEINSINDYSFVDRYANSQVYNIFSYAAYGGQPDRFRGIIVYVGKDEPLENYFFSFMDSFYNLNKASSKNQAGCYGLRYGDTFIGFTNYAFIDKFEGISGSSRAPKHVAMRQFDPGNGTILLVNKENKFKLVGVNLGACNEE